MKDLISIARVGEHVGETVKIGAWVADKSGKGKLQFLQLRDGTAFFQAVVFKPTMIEKYGEEAGLAKFDEIKHLSQETSIIVTGVVKADERSKFGYELDVTDLEVVGQSSEYPITPKEHGTDFLLDHRHLWLRSKKQQAVMMVRNEIIRATYEFFNKEGHIKIDTPILQASSAEDSTELFEIDYFGQPVYLSQTGQLYLEAAAMAYGKVFNFGPVFRAEKSKTRRHLTEFWMIEQEAAFQTHEESLDIQEAYVKYIIQGVLDNCQSSLEVLERDTSLLQKYVDQPFKRVRYDEVISILQEHEKDEDTVYEHIEAGDDLGAPHEAFISNYFGVPTFVMNYPTEIKAFYMKREEGNPERVVCADLLAPEGYGEIIGGSEREVDYDVLTQVIKDWNLTAEEYDWYMDLRRFGSVPHSGFGLGLERAITFITGNEHIREAIPFPRMINRVRP
ncbi:MULTISPECIES: asparagine--tRNA ligase [unclassified Lactococcus]|uniref:asparagine--tRNA ligase n=1 Tax=unclassified Lactococcus TaxID=2643510 RepID=UPI0011CA2BE3|nr:MULTISPECIES: asparagine--tRNA ligase [unclassified Lactococcus]MQW22045.1 asparagine--tRNA ligase [Lactococcus sp. dk101]TXK44988.1 asparagine--tRNA ligase [Lactococcus sp. dk310]TXK51231.1 asparagine--tRNA ligase [Lactococcus sp. dk322]